MESPVWGAFRQISGLVRRLRPGQRRRRGRRPVPLGWSSHKPQTEQELLPRGLAMPCAHALPLTNSPDDSTGMSVPGLSPFYRGGNRASRGKATSSWCPPDGRARWNPGSSRHLSIADEGGLWGGWQGGTLTAGPCLQVPPWSACPRGSMATCTSPCWSPALCTAPCPSGCSCGGTEPDWARKDTFSEWVLVTGVPRPGGLRGWVAGEGPWSQS